MNKDRENLACDEQKRAVGDAEGWAPALGGNTLPSTSAPSEEERSALLEQIGPLPLRGMAWPRWIKVMAWIVLGVIAVRLAMTAASPVGKEVSPVVAGSILLCFVALVVIARYMMSSETTISRTGIEQTWIMRREVSWDDIQFAKFIPLFASKRLVCFTSKGRPIVFQAGTPELQVAFARIALVYRRRQR